MSFSKRYRSEDCGAEGDTSTPLPYEESAEAGDDYPDILESRVTTFRDDSSEDTVPHLQVKAFALLMAPATGTVLDEGCVVKVMSAAFCAAPCPDAAVHTRCRVTSRGGVPPSYKEPQGPGAQPCMWPPGGILERDALAAQSFFYFGRLIAHVRGDLRSRAGEIRKSTKGEDLNLHKRYLCSLLRPRRLQKYK
ncbi:hypothetical protein NDU88_001134 [Pleurodeles waltl]|uniref:Uncharacterized protein n=1 Tax=Pleurodeles waltl TaxID=8319 RepID=A0AAV7U716_PLEWA|nr:hypothetical protein NDU88_001134 [Pleurodeles waltl]